MLDRESMFKDQRRMKKVIADDGFILYLKRGWENINDMARSQADNICQTVESSKKNSYCWMQDRITTKECDGLGRELWENRNNLCWRTKKALEMSASWSLLKMASGFYKSIELGQWFQK